MRRSFVLIGLVLVCVLGLAACVGPLKLDSNALLAAGKAHDVRILRDTWGVPHIFGATDADVAYGLAYAHAEDDFKTIQEALLMGRGELGSVKGRDAAPMDYLVQLLRVWPTVEKKYETDLSPETRALCEAYAEGLNLYAALHPDGVLKNSAFPATGKDVVANFVFMCPFFYRLDNEIKDLFKKERQRPLSTKSPVAATTSFLTHDTEIGSNTIAVGPVRSADGATRLAINSHQPWTGPVAWYEAHLVSKEGLDMVGGVFPGSPVILHGHNRNLGWAHTVNMPDLADVYVLEMNPDNLNQYKFDGQWRDLEVKTVKLDVRVFGPVRWKVKREVLWSVYGPAVRQPHGVYAIRYAGMGEIGQVEQWYRMGKAKNFDEWINVVRTRRVPSFNTGYADREGNIFYLFNALFPVRAEGYNWKDYLPGNTSETLWTEFVPFEKLPQVKNPASGFIINCNNTPFRTTIGPDNPKPDGYSPTLGIDTLVTNRCLRALELFGGDDSITEEEFYKYKFDTSYSTSKESMPNEILNKIFAAPASDDPVVQEAVKILHSWDGHTNVENTGTAIAILTLEPVVRAEFMHDTPPDLMETLSKRAHLLKDTYGRIDVPWGEVNRIVRGKVDMGLAGGPDVLHAVYGKLEGGRLIGEAGDSYVLLVSWNKEGKVSSRSLHQFGSATLDETSPHYADQVPMFVNCETKPVWLDEADIRAHLEREYRPGEEVKTPAETPAKTTQPNGQNS